MSTLCTFVRFVVPLIALLTTFTTAGSALGQSDVWVLDQKATVDGYDNIIYTSSGQEIQVAFDLAFWSTIPRKMYYTMRLVDSDGNDVAPPITKTLTVVNVIDIKATGKFVIPKNPRGLYSFQISAGRLGSGIMVERDSGVQTFYGEGIGN